MKYRKCAVSNAKVQFGYAEYSQVKAKCNKVSYCDVKAKLGIENYSCVKELYSPVKILIV